MIDREALEYGARVLGEEARKKFTVSHSFDRAGAFGNHGEVMRERAARLVAAGYALRSAADDQEAYHGCPHVWRFPTMVAFQLRDDVEHCVYCGQHREADHAGA